ncbi:MAG: replication-associated recombination protein A [bacterium]
MKPLADALRPVDLKEFFGQEKILAPGTELHSYFNHKNFPSLLLWGPPGSGKTTLANLIFQYSPSIPHFKESAVKIGVNRIREIGDGHNLISSPGSYLFLDEIHRFSKSQQDVLLPYVEQGKIILIGATTENPSFYLNSPLMSRLRLFVLEPLPDKAIEKILHQGLHYCQSAQYFKHLDKNQIKQITSIFPHIISYSEGDARRALNFFEAVIQNIENIDKIDFSKKIFSYDKQGDYFYDLISAFHKSVRASDPQGALYYLARMIMGGADPAYIFRRMIRIASEDIGLADPLALVQVTQARSAFDVVGMPEAELLLVQAAIYLAVSPKSNSIYQAWDRVQQEVKKTGSIPVPLHLRNAPTKLAQQLKHGHGYKYDHDYPHAFSGQTTLPPQLSEFTFYHPQTRGFEREINKRLKWWEQKKRNIKN